MTDLYEALADQRQATANLARVVADTWDSEGSAPRDVVEALELLRSQLHRGVDDLIDEEEVRRPPAGPCFRVRRYHELTVPTA